MKFNRIIGKINPELIAKAEKMLSLIFLDLALRYGNEHVGTALGGDPFLFSMLQPMQHIATLNINTAATDGRRYYWNPKFILSRGKEARIAMRLVAAHEAWHAIYMHPSRRGSRHPKLWNIAVDFIVNWTVMSDLRSRKQNPSEFFQKYLGNFVLLEQYANHLRNPFVKIPGTEHFVPEPPGVDEEGNPIVLPVASEDRALTEKEEKELERLKNKIKYFFADPDLPADMRKPEKIYDYLYHILPKCPKCGKVGIYQYPKEDEEEPFVPPAPHDHNENEQNKPEPSEPKEPKELPPVELPDDDDLSLGPVHTHDDPDHHSHDHDDEHEPDCSCSDPSEEGDEPAAGPDGTGPSQPGPGNKPGQHGPGCSGPGGCEGYDIFGFGDTLDDHMDANESPEKMAKRLADAIESAKKMAGHVPGELEDELNSLMAPRVRWQDFIRVKLIKTRDGNGRNDWTRFKTRQLFAGLLIPKRKNNYASFGCLLDTSGSMSKDDMTFGVSQLQSLDEKSEGWIVPADATVYWDHAVKLRKVNAGEISQIKVVGRGGTMFAQFFDNYEKEMGKTDFLIVITDGYLLDTDVAAMKNPGVDVIWLITSSCSFNAPFGRVFELKSL